MKQQQQKIIYPTETSDKNIYRQMNENGHHSIKSVEIEKNILK